MARETHKQEIARYETVLKEAVANWDGVSYVEACEGLGIEPEFNDLYEQGLAEIQYSEFNEQAKGIDGGLETIADSSTVTKPAKRKRVSKNHEKYARFIKATKEAEVDVNQHMQDSKTKRRILIEVMGYHNLKVDGGKLPILEVTDSVIGRTYKSCYNQARRNHPNL